MHIQLTLPDNDQHGIRWSNVSGPQHKAIAFRRDEFLNIRDDDRHSYINRPGVYILIGVDETGRQCGYIGEGHKLVTRLNTQFGTQQPMSFSLAGEPLDFFWQHTVAFTSMADWFKRANAAWVERRLIRDARETANWTILNTQTPPPNDDDLHEFTLEDTRQFARIAKILTAVFGWWDLFHDWQGPRQEAAPVPETPDSPTFFFQGPGYNARMEVVRSPQTRYVVKKGSIARAEVNDTVKGNDGNNVLPTRKKLKKDRTLRRNEDGSLVFAKDHPFTSCATAAEVVAGRRASGSDVWVTNDGITLGKWRRDQ